MARLHFDGHDLRLIADPGKALVRDVMQLQTESGLKLEQIRDLGERNETFALTVAVYLTTHNAGIFIKWADLIARPLEDIGRIVAEPGDQARIAELDPEPDAADPLPAASETPEPDVAAPAPATLTGSGLRIRSRG